MGAAVRRGWGSAIVLLALGAGAFAADFPDFVDGPPPPAGPRFFPRGDGEDSIEAPLAPRRLRVGCPSRRDYIPTDAPDDPSYVGSPYGLGKPSYYGFRPGLGHDDPYGRPLRACPQG